MSKLFFIKYQSAGNDFILIDNRALHFDPSRVAALCHRNFGIGADGVILLQNDLVSERKNFQELDPSFPAQLRARARQLDASCHRAPHFAGQENLGANSFENFCVQTLVADCRMRIFNSDGSEPESCGNGLCCLMQFLLHLGLPKKPYRIATADRIVEADFVGEKIGVKLQYTNVKQLYIDGCEMHVLDTGVPHAVLFVSDLQGTDVRKEGAFLRYHPLFQPRGVNVNFAAMQSDRSIQVRTYERGLEGESLACGTGAAAVAVIATRRYAVASPIRICSAGGHLDIFVEDHTATIVGEATKVFEGMV